MATPLSSAGHLSKTKLINGLLIVTSLLGYLEWGKGNRMFLFQGEAEILSRLFKDFRSAIHPLTVLPLLGQVLLLVTLFQKQPRKWLSWTGFLFLGLLLFFLFIIGLISPNYKILLSSLPFLTTGFLAVHHLTRHYVK
ncbi:MAG TPA: hypothetical protein VL098_14995 [Flavipsychrobacter sp.]|nr:hypothetical protein [Flavipsychrobacter sp.]